ncbi:MAG TPA: hypothetical protein VN688_32155 [Gemmataceae bacterium]|nr:hypothetical protein [Gemmataceae bacterium]
MRYVFPLLAASFLAFGPVKAADEKPDAAQAMKHAPTVLKEVLALAKDDKRLAPQSKQNIAVEQYKTDNEAGVSLHYETTDSWPDMPSKPKGRQAGNGSVQVKILRGTAKTSLDAPFLPPKGCYYALSVYGTSVPGIQISIWSMTADRAAHGRLETIVLTRLKTAGIVIDEKPLTPTVRAGEAFDGTPTDSRPKER